MYRFVNLIEIVSVVKSVLYSSHDTSAVYSGVHSEEVMTRKMTKKTVTDH